VPVVRTVSHIRIDGLDLARGIAILGMVLVNFSIDTNDGDAPDWLPLFVGAIQGRAAALFVVLAGVGISLLSRRARLDDRPELFHSVRVTLLKRAAFLLALGAALLPLWPADILHFYAVYLTASIFFLQVSSRTLWVSAITFTATFAVMFFVFDYNAGWNAEGEYVYLWTSTFRRVWFDGYYPVFPWMAFLLTGMWLGRRDLQERHELNKVLMVALSIGLVVQLCSWYLTGLSPLVDMDSAIKPLDLLGTSPYPPGPAYIVTSAAFAVAAIVLSIKVTRALPKNLFVRILIPSGQLALSIYVLHATLGILLLDSVLHTTEDSLIAAVAFAGGFCAVAATFAVVWRLDYERGPLESLMRRLTRN